MTVSLEVKAREGKLIPARELGDIPAVVYGPKQESLSLAVDKQTFEKLFAEAGESTIITLEGLTEPIEVLVQDVAFNPERGGVVHVDFYAIERGKELTTNVSLEFVGEAPAEKEGTVVKAMQEVEVTTRPSLLPPSIEVDLTKLDTVDAQIFVKDLPVAEGVTIENDPESVVATIAVAKEEPEEEAEAPDMDAIEVEAKGKEEEAEAPAEEEA
ncbi:50S ribosomal protein L25 [bacterium]|nr:50S ribosomal protein L25 [bacterium]